MSQSFPIGVQLQSSSLDIVAYRPADASLAVLFKSGSGYIYQDVPESVWMQLLKAGSHGGFFAEEIKGAYPTTAESVSYGKVISLENYLRGPLIKPFVVDPKEMKTMASAAWW